MYGEMSDLGLKLVPQHGVLLLVAAPYTLRPGYCFPAEWLDVDGLRRIDPVCPAQPFRWPLKAARIISMSRLTRRRDGSEVLNLISESNREVCNDACRVPLFYPAV